MGYQVYLSLKGWQIVLCRVGELLLYKRTCWLEWPKETELLRLLSRYLIIVLFSDSSRRTGSIWFFSFAQYFPSFSANYFTVWKWINLINIHLFICVFFFVFLFSIFHDSASGQSPWVNWKWQKVVRLSCHAIWVCRHWTMPFTLLSGSWNPTRSRSIRK